MIENIRKNRVKQFREAIWRNIFLSWIGDIFQMKKSLCLSVLIIFVISIVGCNNQPPIKEQYQLQEQCKKSGEEWFKKDYFVIKCNYKNHYNNKLNKCLMLVSCNDGVNHEILFNVNEYNQFGSVRNFKKGFLLYSLLGKELKSKTEWDKLVKPYMEE